MVVSLLSLIGVAGAFHAGVSDRAGRLGVYWREHRRHAQRDGAWAR
jgi:hypothetical protein